MPIPFLMNGLRLVVVLAIVAGVLSFGGHSTLSHDPGAILATLAGGEDGVGHGHDHDADGEQPFGHGPGHTPPGHNPLDHSHAAMAVLMMSATVPSSAETVWHGGPPRPGGSEPLYPLDRPPRSGIRP